MGNGWGKGMERDGKEKNKATATAVVGGQAGAVSRQHFGSILLVMVRPKISLK